MNGTEKVIKHLEMIQAVIKRLGLNSFLVKGGSLVIVITSQVLLVNLVFTDSQNPGAAVDESIFFAAAAVVIFLILGFWILDGFFLRQNRLFRHHYDAVRHQDDTDFNMDIGKYMNKPKSSWIAAIFSVTLVIFYLIEIAFILIPAAFLFWFIFY